MTDRDLEQKIRTAFANATPDDLDAVRSRCAKQKGTVTDMTQYKNNKNRWRRFAAVAAALVLVLGLGAGLGVSRSVRAVAATVSLDVNPSIQITVNKNERVLEVTPLNEDAVTVIGDMDFEGSDLDVAVNALIGSMLRNGYLNELANSILVSVADKDVQRGKALEKRLALEIDSLLNTDTFQGSVLSQTVATDTQLDTLAQQHHITSGKAQLIQQILAETATRYTFEDLAGLSINQLNLISETGSLQLDQVTTTGSASEKAYIGVEAAKQAALAHFAAELPDTAAEPRWEWELDWENGSMVYDLEFEYPGPDSCEFECEVNALTGAIHHAEHNHADHHQDDHEGDHHSTGAQQPTVTPQPQSSITADAAKAAALAHAGVTADDARELECELDSDGPTPHYDVDFKAGGFEFDYEISAADGSILHIEKERDD